ncbi:DUF6114 domain-containing protein [Microbacterium gorillae]|uniref:DUF6114 domain-containing protein n=1 Tax=Microbacterium gorillae TaxID=1231063 RepID=UPI0006939102|nr:DUF6114 domain-containing protein [Microbacterium gorillae]
MLLTRRAARERAGAEAEERIGAVRTVVIPVALPDPETSNTEDFETADTLVAPEAAAGVRARFARWRRERPLIGGSLIAIAGIEMFFSGQLDIGRIHIQLGIQGLQAMVIPVVLVVLGVLIVLMPAHHVFYGVIALVVALYALVGVNLGGFLLGTVLGAVGGVIAVSWLTPEARERALPGTEAGGTAA